ncbi:MAG: Fic family protein, partial [Proteobacteria bacterium]|nr:Fic family protein [Pseudomonadota bacterium]
LDDRVAMDRLAAELFGESNALKIIPCLPGTLDEYHDELVAASIHASAALAGNPMPLDEASVELERKVGDPELPSGPTVARARREITNLALAYKPLPIGRVESSVFGVSEGFVKKVQTVLAQGTSLSGLGDYVPSTDGKRTQGQTQAEMLRLITWINASEATNHGPLVRAALFHYGMLRLRPFADANGRTARFFETSILTVAGVRFASLWLPVHYHRNIDQYLAFCQDEASNVSAFVTFMLHGVRQGLELARLRLIDPLRTLALKAYFDALRHDKTVKTRLHQLLHLLIDHQESFQIRDLYLRQPFKLLYDEVSEHTTRRDLNKLIALGLLTKDGTSYAFNRNALG